MTIFIDSSVFCAFANKRDVHHKNAVEIIRNCVKSEYGKPITTDYVFDEIISVITRRTNRDNAIKFGVTLLDSEIFIAKIDATTFEKSWNIFKKEKNFNFTDCSILSFMKTFQIKKLATFDKEFKRIKWIEVLGV
jgi:uncharacterized protein